MDRPTVSIITPWLDHLELLDAYSEAVQGADQVIIIDNGSTPPLIEVFDTDSRTQHWAVIRNEDNRYFAAACNQGLAVAACDIIVMLNNDITATGDWLKQVRRDVIPDILCGPALAAQVVDDMRIPYLEGWCLAARRAVWEHLGGFDTERYARCYWEDIGLAWQAYLAGIQVVKTEWAITHLSNTTSRDMPDAHAMTPRNRAAFYAHVRQTRGQLLARASWVAR